jgi:hypothetical protein
MERSFPEPRNERVEAPVPGTNPSDGCARARARAIRRNRDMDISIMGDVG